MVRFYMVEMVRFYVPEYYYSIIGWFEFLSVWMHYKLTHSSNYGVLENMDEVSYNLRAVAESILQCLFARTAQFRFIFGLHIKPELSGFFTEKISGIFYQKISLNTINTSITVLGITS